MRKLEWVEMEEVIVEEDSISDKDRQPVIVVFVLLGNSWRSWDWERDELSFRKREVCPELLPLSAGDGEGDSS
jgi:hypothetical protein